MTDRTGALLVELAKLARRYGPEEFERLADVIGKPEFASSLSEILRQTARASRTHADSMGSTGDHPGPKAGKRITMSALLDRLREQQPEKFAIVSEIRQRLAEKRALPMLADVMIFAENHRYRLEGKRTRDQAVASLLRVLVDLPEKDLRQVLENLPTSPEEKSDLRGWSDIIMNRGPRER